LRNATRKASDRARNGSVAGAIGAMLTASGLMVFEQLKRTRRLAIKAHK
jgi:hypothetical protein